MKKLLLIAAMFAATFSANAQFEAYSIWEKTFTPVTTADELGGVHVATTLEGDVYASTTYNQVFNFAGKAVTDPEEMTSSTIVKYDKYGKEQWVVTLVGKAVVHDLATDTDGTLYVAGNFIDEVAYTGADAVAATMKSFGDYSAFVAKISKDGKIEVVKTFEPVGNMEVVYSEFPFYLPDEDPIYVTPNKIQVDGDKVYVSANYKGDVADFGWKGAYLVNYDFGMYMDNRSSGVFSLNKSDLGDATNVAYVQATGIIAENQHYSEAISFVAENGTVYVGFFGFGNLTITTPVGSKDFSFATADDETGNKEHAFVLATIASSLTTKVFNAAKHDKDAKPYNLFMNVEGNNLIVGGTYYGELPFDNAKSTGDLASELFVVNLNKADGNVQWVYTDGKESVAQCMGTDQDEVIISKEDDHFSLSLLDAEKDTDDEIKSALRDLYNLDELAQCYIKVSDTEVTVGGIYDLDAAAAFIASLSSSSTTNTPAFNLVGQPVGADYKGIVVKNNKKYYQR